MADDKPAEALLPAQALRALHPPSPSAYSEGETIEEVVRHRDHLVGMMPGMVWYCPMNPDATLQRAVYISRYLQRFAGYAPEDWINTPGFWSGILDPEQRDEVLAATARALRGEGTIPAYRLRKRDGQYIWIQSTLAVERTADGTPVRMYGLSLDITRYKEAELQAAESLRRESELHDRLEGLIDSVPGVVWERAEGEAAGGFCSEFVEQLSGYSAAQWQALPGGWLDLTPEGDRAPAAQAWQEAWAQPASAIRHRLTRRDGQLRWVEHHVRVFAPAGQARCMRGIALDISERVAAEDERERLRAQVARQSTRIAELSTPLIALDDQVVLMPIIGAIDGERAERLLAALLDGLQAGGARTAVIDVTGVSSVDHSSMQLLGRAARAARLLGTRVVVTGIRAEMARALVNQGIELPGVELRSTLQGAIRELLRPAQPLAGKHAPAP
jgi:rsbT co-antagonist protein RsbR